MQLNKMIEFRQQIYDHALTKARDAQFELIDALLSNRTIQSFPELSLSPLCQRQWHRLIDLNPSLCVISSWCSTATAK